MFQHIKKHIHTALCIAGTLSAMQVLFSCSDELTSTYSNKDRVVCSFSVLQYTELFGVIGNYGQFASIRQSGSNIIMQSSSSKTSYSMDATQKYFSLGLGGLIVGTSYEGEYLAYDLACPNCDRADKRLSISNDGYARCQNSKCHIQYNLNNHGVISEVPEENVHDNPRGLFRYRIAYDGQYVHVYN